MFWCRCPVRESSAAARVRRVRPELVVPKEGRARFCGHMAAQGGVPILEKVSRLLSRQNGKPVLKPNRPLVLRDAVANRKLRKGGKSAERDRGAGLGVRTSTRVTDHSLSSAPVSLAPACCFCVSHPSCLCLQRPPASRRCPCSWPAGSRTTLWTACAPAR